MDLVVAVIICRGLFEMKQWDYDTLAGWRLK